MPQGQSLGSNVTSSEKVLYVEIPDYSLSPSYLFLYPDRIL